MTGALILLTGPTAAGKTDTAWELLELAPPMVFLESDWFASRRPFSWDNLDDIRSVYEGLNVLLSQHARAGRTRFVVTLTLEMALQPALMKACVDMSGLVAHPFCLSATPDVLLGRISKRGRSGEQQQSEQAGLSRQLRQCALLSKDFRTLDTSLCDEADVAKQVLQLVQQPG